MERTGTRIIRTASVETVLSPWFLRQIGLRIDALGLSRLKTTGWLSDTIWNWEGRILDASGGNLLRDPDIVETAYGGEESCRWNSDVKRFARTPPRRAPRASLALRLQLWDAAFKIAGAPVDPTHGAVTVFKRTTL